MAGSASVSAGTVKRLLRDLAEVLSEPLPDVRAQPLEDNLYVWHGNMRASEEEGVLGGASIHFVLLFPADYPTSAPECRLFTPVPHPNVIRKSTTQGWGRTAPWRLALWDCIPGKNAWSSAYSAQSVLVQLQAFLFKEDLQYDVSKVEPERAAALAQAFTCKQCGSCQSDPTPSFDHQPSALHSCSTHHRHTIGIPDFIPARNRSSSLARLRPAGRVQAAKPAAAAKSSAAALTPASSAAAKPATPSLPATTSAASAALATTALAVSEEDVWVEVQYKKKKPPVTKQFGKYSKFSSSASKANHAGKTIGYGGNNLSQIGKMANGNGLPPQPLVAASTSYATSVDEPSIPVGMQHANSVLSSNPYETLQAWEAAQAAAAAAVAAAKNSAQPSASASYPSSQASDVPGAETPALLKAVAKPMSKASKKNMARSKKRQAKKEVEGGEAADAGTMSAAPIKGKTCEATHATGSTSTTNIAATAHSGVGTTATAHGGVGTVANGTASQPSAPATAPAGAATNSSPNGPAHSATSTVAAADDWVAVKSKAKATTQSENTSDSSSPAAAALLVGVTPTLDELLHMDASHLAAIHHDDPKALISAVLKTMRPPNPPATNAAGPSTGTHTPPPSSAPLTAHPPLPESVSPDYSLPMGAFTPLPRDVLLGMLLSSDKKDIGAIATCCKGLAAAVNDGELWHALLKQHYPGSRLQVSDASAWRRAYMLESALVMDELRCFHTRDSFEHEVLGLPLRYTTNPKTGMIDYIEPDADLLSVRAFLSGVDKSPVGERIDVVLPLYITAEHFERAQGQLQKVLKKLAPHLVGPGGRGPDPRAWLDVIPKILNTCIVLLSDKGTLVSDKALTCYTCLHRLLLALCERFDLWPEAAARVAYFMASPANRVKSAVPNLGELLPLLSLVPSHDWRTVGPAIMNEMFDRSVLWMCKNSPGELPGLMAAPHVKDEVDSELLRLCWEGSVVSKRLLMFHVAFLRMVACPAGMGLEAVMDSYDTLYGRPAAGLVRRFGRHVKRVLEAETWRQFFQFSGMGQPSDAYLTGWMKQCWSSSMRKKYHTKDTDFSRIQASGVSKILLKGETYTAPPGMKRIEMHEHWKWEGAGTKYLDASCLLYGPAGEWLETIDFAHRTSLKTSIVGAVSHSGDVMTENSGTHEVQINLGQLGEGVETLVITMSSWAGAKLSEIKQPYVQVFDPKTKMDLCQYHLEDQAGELKSRSSAIIMCTVARKAGGQWGVKAIGHVGQGAAGDYEPILKDIQRVCFNKR